MEEGRRVKVLVTGCNGLLGGDLVEALRARSHDVVGCDLPSVDITNPVRIAETVKGFLPDVVVHTAAMTDVDGCETDPEAAFATNGLGTRNVAVACQENGASLVYVSTDFVFDGSSDCPYREFDPTHPLCVYGASKLAGEEYTRHIVPRHMVVRTAWLYGPRGKNFVNTMLRIAGRGGPLRVVDDQIGSPTYSRDLADAMAELVETGLWGTYHVTNRGSTSWCSFAREILRLTGFGTRPVRPITSQELKRPARRPAYSVLDLSATESTIGRKMRDWSEALHEFLGATGELALNAEGER